MKAGLFKVSILVLTTSFTFPVQAWRETGHFAVCEIAWNHLTRSARAQINDLIDGKSFAEQCTWADIVRPTEVWRHTAYWHYISLDDGEGYFDRDAINPKGDILQAMLESGDALLASITTQEQKTAWLRFIGHFIGDVHQPLHVGKKKDNGGNKIKVKWFGRTNFNSVLISQAVPPGQPCVGSNLSIHEPTGECVETKAENESINLHKVWDLQIIEKYMLDVGLRAEPGDSEYLHKALAKHLDRGISRDTIKHWQDVQMKGWVDESLSQRDSAYDIGSGSLGQRYYEGNVGLVKTRILQGGYRLAAFLNRTFDQNDFGLKKAKFVDYLFIELKERIKRALAQ